MENYLCSGTKSEIVHHERNEEPERAIDKVFDSQNGSQQDLDIPSGHQGWVGRPTVRFWIDDFASKFR